MTGTTGNVVQDRGSAQMCRQMIRNLLLVLSGPSHTHTHTPSSFLSTLWNHNRSLSWGCCVTGWTLHRQSCYLKQLIEWAQTLGQYKSSKISEHILSLNNWRGSKNGHCEATESHPLICIGSQCALIVSSLVLVNITIAAIPLLNQQPVDNEWLKVMWLLHAYAKESPEPNVSFCPEPV